ncbi:hypothetical protein CXB51_016720 [Gossypium anomalum]|uniref:Aluminum-activated malate transporter 2-like n=1 Tax=Gossypium anomalum TaxID=47600 RepID=A0A8J6CYV7_9ROSI|nr:hypothetical protein CXB51_016720 [Gossypium anomalum]
MEANVVVEGGSSNSWSALVKDSIVKIRCKVAEFPGKMKKVAEDDPRRIVHSFKVGLAITLVSLFYYFDDLYVGFGSSAMWAVLTVIVVIEFSVGATLGKGLNRGLATFLAGTLGFGAHHLANLPGQELQPILLEVRYDYGLLIFMLTFCLISVSGYRDEEVLEMAHKRVSTILIGGFTAIFVCILICPIWAGEDLHNLAANNLEKLASFLEGFGDEYFRKSSEPESNKASLQVYKSILNSKQSEESLVNFARWEPPHGRFRFRHPWKQYLKIGSLTRQCAYRIEALNGCLNSDASPETCGNFREAFIKASSETGKDVKGLASAMRTMTLPSADCPQTAKSKNAADNLKSLLRTGLCEGIDIVEILEVATVASLLLDILACTEKISESIHELASLAHFKRLEPDEKDGNPDLDKQKQVRQSSNSIASNHHHHIISIE